MYIVLSCNVKKLKTIVIMSYKIRNKRRSHRFSIVSFEMTALILSPFSTIAQHESGTRKAIYWAVTVNSKNIYPGNAI